MVYRKHQKEMIRIVNEIIDDSSIKTIIVHVAPGSGKSIFKVFEERLKKLGRSDRTEHDI